MPIRTTTHLNFSGDARAALDFYHAVLKGQQTLVTYAQAGQAENAADPEHVIWGQVATEDGVVLMAYDVQAGRDWHPGANAFYVSLRGDDADTVRALWDGLADGGAVLQALGPSPWSPLYGMLRDRFGITWVIDLALQHAPA